MSLLAISEVEQDDAALLRLSLLRVDHRRANNIVDMWVVTKLG